MFQLKVESLYMRPIRLICHPNQDDFPNDLIAVVDYLVFHCSRPVLMDQSEVREISDQEQQLLFETELAPVRYLVL